MNNKLKYFQKETWIGGRIEQINGNFTWMDGTPWDFENWETGEFS